MDAQQELFTAIRAACVEVFGEQNTYDTFLPPDGTPYPFVYLADVFQYEDDVKSGDIGDVTINVHVWHNNPRERGRVSGWLMAIKGKSKQITETTSYGWVYRANASTESILPDTTTKTPLLHGILELRFKYSRR